MHSKIRLTPDAITRKEAAITLQVMVCQEIVSVGIFKNKNGHILMKYISSSLLIMIMFTY